MAQAFCLRDAHRNTSRIMKRMSFCGLLAALLTGLLPTAAYSSNTATAGNAAATPAVTASAAAATIRPATQADALPTGREVLATVEKANRYFMDKYQDVTAQSFVRNRYRPSHIWTRGVYYEGLMELYRICPRDQYYDYAYRWADFHEWSFRNGSTTRNADDQCAGQTYLELYSQARQPEMMRHTKACMDMLVNTPQTGDWTWIDAIQMAMPVLGQLGTLTGDARYYEKAWQMYSTTRNEIGKSPANPDCGLWNPKDGLWWRDADFCPPYTEPNGEDCYWSRGNGWVFVALCRYMDRTPATESHRNQYLADFKAMAKAILACQREDGFWNCSLHDPDHFGGKETTGTALFVSGFAWGVRQGWLDAKTYMPAIVKGWQALTEAVHPDNGFLGYVQGTGKEPKDSQPTGYDIEPDFEDFALGCFLLAGTEVYKLCR